MPVFNSVTIVKLPDGREVDEKFAEEVEANSKLEAKKIIEKQWDDAARQLLANALSMRYSEVFDAKKLKINVEINDE